MMVTIDVPETHMVRILGPDASASLFQTRLLNVNDGICDPSWLRFKRPRRAWLELNSGTVAPMCPKHKSLPEDY